jgi:hypothetical protein
MKFTHLIQINDITNPLIDEISRPQLWAGLKLRAHDPSQFVVGLDSFHVVKRSETELVRELRFGRLAVRDRVSFMPMNQVRYEIEPAPEVPAGTLVTTIEEPEPGQLFVRFEYDTKPIQGGPPVDPYYQEFVKEAYMEADIDAIRTIRRLITEGKLGEEDVPPNGVTH